MTNNFPRPQIIDDVTVTPRVESIKFAAPECALLDLAVSIDQIGSGSGDGLFGDTSRKQPVAFICLSRR